MELTEDQRKYADNLVKYNLEMYKRLSEKLETLAEDDYVENAFRSFLIGASTGHLLKINELNKNLRALFNEEVVVPEDIQVKLNEIKDPFFLQGNKLMNISGMEVDELIKMSKEKYTPKSE